MAQTKSDLSAHSVTVLNALKKSATPMSAYDILEALRAHGIKAPPTVYRALDSLIARGLVHRIETLGAFVACHDHADHESGADISAQFAVCRDCGTVEELHDAGLAAAIRHIGSRIAFRIEREMLEIVGLCSACARKTQPV